MIKNTTYLFCKIYLFLLSLLPAVLLGQKTETHLYHQVKQEDGSLWRIAQEYETTVVAIQKANKLTTTLIKPKQILRIPVGQFKKYVVQKTDKSLWQIATYHELSLDALRKCNAFKNDYIHIGDTLLLPTADLTNRAIVRQEEKVVKQGNKTYKVVIEVERDILGGKIEDNTVNLYLYKQQQEEWLLVDQKYHLETVGAENSYIDDYDENGKLDVLLLVSIGARAYYTYFNLFVIDDKKDRWRKIEGFDEISSPSYDFKEKGFRYSYFAAQTGAKVISDVLYRIDYESYKVKKKGN